MVKCEICGSKKIYADEKTGDIVCEICGFVSEKYKFLEGEVYEV